VHVTGKIWNASHPRTIGLNALTANILCRSHNSGLSPLDASGGEATRALGEFIGSQARRRRVRTTGNFIETHGVDGALFERLLLKTLINFVVAKDGGEVWAGSQAHDDPPLNLVQVAFGLARLLFPAGLYMNPGARSTIRSDRDGLECTTLVDAEMTVVGAKYLFRGFPFLLWIDEQTAPHGSIGVNLKDVLHRPKSIKGQVGDVVTSELVFRWP
jgi:hypothetical protein